MSDYWYGAMNWPLRRDWSCVICGGRDLVRGFAYGECRCAVCHVIYHMLRDGQRVTVPECRLGERFLEPGRVGWEKWRQPLNEWAEERWDEAFEMTEEAFGR